MAQTASLRGKAVLITGASRGIGRAAAELFAARGCRLLLNYHRSEAAARTLEQSLRGRGADAQAHRADVSDPAQAAALAAACEERFGRIDVLVCNAGVAQQKQVTDLTDEDWRRMAAVHTDGAFYCCRAALPGMIRRKCGSIVLVSSIWGLAGASCEVHYSAAKAALVGMTRSLAREVGPSGVRVNCVAPGVIDTDMNAALDADARRALADGIPLGRFGTAEEAAEAIVFLASPQAGYITGQTLAADGGYLA